MKKKYTNELAKKMKNYENLKYFESVVGKVVAPPPNLSISIFGGDVVLDKEQLYINDFLLVDYNREFKEESTIEEVDISTDLVKVDSLKTNTWVHTTTATVGTGPVGQVKTTSANIDGTTGEIKGKSKGDRDFKIKDGTITLTDTLKKDDLVKLTPVENGQIWFVDYKVVKL